MRQVTWSHTAAVLATGWWAIGGSLVSMGGVTDLSTGKGRFLAASDVSQSHNGLCSRLIV